MTTHNKQAALPDPGDDVIDIDAQIVHLKRLIQKGEARRLGRTSDIQVVSAIYEGPYIVANMQGTSGKYQTRITFQPRPGHHCTCPDWERNGTQVGPCKHVLKLAESWLETLQDKLDELGASVRFAAQKEEIEGSFIKTDDHKKEARTYNRIVMFDFDGTLFKSWEETPDWWPDQRPYSFFLNPESLDEPCVPGHPSSDYWISHAVSAAKKASSDAGTYTVLITGRVKAHGPRIIELLAQKGIRVDKVYLNPGMSAKVFKTRLLGMLLVSHPLVNDVEVWENENQSHYAEYLRAAKVALGREDVQVSVFNIHERAKPLLCGPSDFGISVANVVAAYEKKARTYTSLILMDFDGTLFKSWKSIPDWWPDETPDSFYAHPNLIEETCLPDVPSSTYWLNYIVAQAKQAELDPDTYVAVITNRAKEHSPRITALLKKKGIRVDRLIFNPGMAAPKFRMRVLQVLLTRHPMVTDIEVWETERESYEKSYAQVAQATLGRDDVVINTFRSCMNNVRHLHAGQILTATVDQVDSEGQLVYAGTRAKQVTATEYIIDDGTHHHFPQGFNVVTAGDGKKVGVFIPVPAEFADQFESSTYPPHVTLLYVGEVPKDRESEFIKVVSESVGKEPGPIRAKLGAPDFFVKPESDNRIWYSKVSFSKEVAEIRDRLWLALEDAGFSVENSFPLAFFPHVTLKTVKDAHKHDRWEGSVPEGIWEFDTVSIWGTSKEVVVPLGEYALGDNVKLAAEKSHGKHVGDMLKSISTVMEAAAKSDLSEEQTKELQSAYKKVVDALPKKVSDDIQAAYNEKLKNKTASPAFFMAAVYAASQSANKHEAGDYEEEYDVGMDDALAKAFYSVDNIVSKIAEKVGGAFSAAAKKVSKVKDTVKKLFSREPPEGEEKPKSEGKGTYKDYIERKKERGGRPLSQKEWEARYK